MASLIPCPHCGMRPKEEFTIKGSADVRRPAPEADAHAWLDYVYLRENPMGRLSEYWHHSSGCRRWLVVARDSVSHDIYSVQDAAKAKGGGA